MAVALRFHAVVHKKQQLVSGWKDAELDSLFAGRGTGTGQQLKAFTKVTESAVVAAEPGEGGSSRGMRALFPRLSTTSKAVRVEATPVYGDRMLVCAGTSTTLERLAVAAGAEVVNESEESAKRRDLSPAGDSATSTERLRLESQWTMCVEEELSQKGIVILRGEKTVDDGTSFDKQAERTPVCSGKPKARRRRLEARKVKLSNTECRPPVGAFTIFPRRRADGRSEHKRVEGVQGYVSTYLREISKIDRLTLDEEVMLSKIIRIGYLLKAERKKLERTMGHELSKDQWADHVSLSVADLDAKIHESELARDRMVMANLRLVLSVVKQYSCDGLEVADLIQEGTIGLLKGVEKFDHNRGYKLSTYVHWWIRQGVTRAIADHSRTVRLPVHVHDAVGRIRRARAKMLQDGDQAIVENLGETLNLSGNQVNAALKVPKMLKSLDMQIGLQRSLLSGDSETFHSLIADQHSENQPWTMVERAQLKGDVEKVLNTHLGSREREIVKMHFGVDTQDGSPMSLENISHRYGISRERVRQLERAAKQKLQTTRNGLDKYFGILA